MSDKLVRICNRYDTAENLANVILKKGELACDSENMILKIGDGIANFKDNEYAFSGSNRFSNFSLDNILNFGNKRFQIKSIEDNIMDDDTGLYHFNLFKPSISLYPFTMSYDSGLSQGIIRMTNMMPIFIGTIDNLYIDADNSQHVLYYPVISLTDANSPNWNFKSISEDNISNYSAYVKIYVDNTDNYPVLCGDYYGSTKFTGCIEFEMITNIY